MAPNPGIKHAWIWNGIMLVLKSCEVKVFAHTRQSCDPDSERRIEVLDLDTLVGIRSFLVRYNLKSTTPDSKGIRKQKDP